MTSLGHIYMIWTSLDNSFCYIGSTFNRLHKRFEGHKNIYKKKYGSVSIHKYFDQYGINNFKIELIKSYNVIRIHQKDFKHLHAYETLWINNTKNCINKRVSFNPLKKESNKQCSKEYREKNKKEINEKHKQYYQDNKKEIDEKHKQYRENNKKEISEQRKQHYQKNKKEINEKRNQQFNCECGGKYTLTNRSRHFKTKNHIKFLEN